MAEAAFPKVAGTSQGATASGTAHTVTLPAGIEVGELLLVFFSGRFASTPKTAGFTWAAGWDEVEDEAFDTSANSAHLGIASRVADGSEGADTTVTTAAATEGAFIVLRIAEANGTVQKGTAFTSSSGAVPDPPSVTPIWGSDNTLWIVVDSRNTAGGSTLVSNPTDYTLNTLDQASATLVRLNIAARELEAVSEDPGIFTFSTGQFEVAQTIAVQALTPKTGFTVSNHDSLRTQNRMVGY